VQNPRGAKPPTGVVFDSGMGAGIGDVLALALLCGLESAGEARIISVSVSNSSLKAAAFCEVIRNFYSGRTYRGLPVGLAADGKPLGDSPMLTSPLANPAFRHGIQKLTDTAEPPALIRNALTAQHDQNAVVVLTGPAANLAGLLALPGAKDLIARKVRFLSVAAGVAADRVLDDWPAPVYMCDPAIEESLLYPASSIENDFAWSAAHPVVEAYKAHRPMPYDAPAGQLAAVLYAVRPQESYFQISGQGRRRRLTLDPEQKDTFVRTCTEIVSRRR
jgi:hypothetical protein